MNADAWRRLASAEGEALLAAAAEVADPERPAPRELERLAGLASRELASLAVEVVAARRRAAAKIDSAARLLCDRSGVEQASGTAPAAWKARRVVEKLGRGVRVADLCCGIGGDAIELEEFGAKVVAVDADPARCVMVAHNVSCHDVRAVRSEDVDPGEFEAFHLDPARRTEGGERRRHWRLEDFSPGVAELTRWMTSGLPGALKLGPGADLDALPWGDDCEIEVLGDRRGLRQAVVWCGGLAQSVGLRSAVRVDLGERITGCPEQLRGDTGALDRYLLVPDAALERARLVAAAARERGLAPYGGGLGLLTAAEAVAGPWFESFEVLAELPLRDKPLRRWLRQHDGGEVEVKTRGGVVDANALQRALRGSGAERYVVFAVRIGERRLAIVTRRAR